MINFPKSILLSKLALILLMVSCTSKDELDIYTVTLDTDGGNFIEAVSVLENEKINKPVDPVKDGYVFKGWYTDATFRTEYDFDTPVMQDRTVYARFVKSFTVVLDANMGELSGDAKVFVEEGGTLTAPNAPTRAEHTFVEWQSNGTTYDFGKPVAADLTLVAVWEAGSPNEYTVTFDANGGQLSGTASIKVANGEKIDPPAPPVKTDHYFVEWQANGDPYDFNGTVTADFVLTASWRIVSTTNKETTSVIEGAPFIIKVSVPTAPGSDIVLTGAFDVSMYPASHTNDGDYATALQYSADGGATWKSEANTATVKLPANSASILVKVETNDDAAKEVLKEKVDLRFTSSDNSHSYTYTGGSPTVQLEIEDNDVSSFQRSVLEPKPGYPPLYEIMVFDIADDKVTIFGVAESVATAAEKKVIDEDYAPIAKLVEDIVKVMPQSALELHTLSLGYNSGSNAYGAIQPTFDYNGPGAYGLNSAMLWLNVAYAYSVPSTGGMPVFNGNGSFGRTVVHEFGHLLTYPKAAADTPANCGGDLAVLYNAGGSGAYDCHADGSYGKRFLEEFYTLNAQHQAASKSGLLTPVMITNYAGTGYNEDLAESFAAYVAVGGNTPSADISNAAYKNKIAFYEDFQDARDFKAGILAMGLTVPSFGQLATASGKSASSGKETYIHQDGCVRMIFPPR